ncbi:MAG: hypothetical protein RSA52_03825 [Acetivibrio sp.]
MKFKYKKMIVTITMGTMLIGFAIFSTVTPKSSTVNKKSKIKTEEVLPSPIPQVKEKEAVDTSKIQKDLNPQVTQVVKDYLLASVNCDMDALEETVNNISMVDEKELQLKYEFVEGVSNIECYMIPAPSEGGYLVYIYRDLKIKDVETLAPGLSRVYVAVGADGNYRIFFGADTGLESFINQTDQTKEVKELVEKVNKKMEEAISVDADLSSFIEKITTTVKEEKNKKQ